MFISKDPIGFRGRDTNLYRYVKNNPINKKDPRGLESPEEALAFGVNVPYGLTPGQDFSIDASGTILNLTGSASGQNNGVTPLTLLGASLDITLGQTGNMEATCGLSNHTSVGIQLQNGIFSGITLHAGFGWGSPVTVNFGAGLSQPGGLDAGTANGYMNGLGGP